MSRLGWTSETEGLTEQPLAISAVPRLQLLTLSPSPPDQI